jgi:hypothetical protein
VKFLQLKPLAPISLLAVMALAPASSQSADMMDTMFGQMRTATAPGSYTDSLGTTLYGGSFRSRNSIVSMQPIFTVTPPKIKGGCGGFDLTAGSLSFISGEKLAQFIKSIAQNASNLLVYSFIMGLKSQCQFCENTLTWLENLQNAVNISNLNSCDTAKSIFSKEHNTDGLEAFGNGVVDAFKSHGGWSKPDGLESKQSLSEKGVEGFIADALASITKEEATDLLGGNVVYEILKKKDVASWFGAQGADAQVLYELIMNVLGTSIASHKDAKGKVCTPGPDTCTLKLEPVLPMLSFEEMVLGVKKNKDVWNCSNDSCTELESVKVENSILKGFQSFHEKFDEVFIGSNGQSGLLDKMSEISTPDNPVELTENEKQFVVIVSQFSPIVSQLSQLSSSKVILSEFYNAHSQILTAEMTADLLAEIIRVTELVLNTSTAVSAKKERERLVKRFQVLKKQIVAFKQDKEIQKSRIGDYSEALRAIKGDGQ